jgi:site-specific DNA-methyltransferase (adenine-specific)
MSDVEVNNITLKENGKLDWNGHEVDMHSCAAKVRNRKANRVNGFDFWYVQRNGKLKRISDVREDYREYCKQNKETQ